MRMTRDIAIVSIVFKPRDFQSKLFGLGTKIKLNGSRMYRFLHIMYFSKISGL